ncbi:hypothetical protein PGB90_000969 [Kerria lacca]
MSLLLRIITGVLLLIASSKYFILTLHVSAPKIVFNVSIAAGSAYGPFHNNILLFTQSCKGKLVYLLKAGLHAQAICTN